MTDNFRQFEGTATWTQGRAPHMQNYEIDYAKWIEKVSAFLRKNYNRDYKSLPYAYELRYFSGYTAADVIHELQLIYPDLHVKRSGTGMMERALKY